MRGSLLWIHDCSRRPSVSRFISSNLVTSETIREMESTAYEQHCVQTIVCLMMKNNIFVHLIKSVYLLM